MKIVFLPSASAGLRWFHQYYTSVFADGKKNADWQFQSMKKLLVTTPQVGRPIPGGSCRIYGVPRTPFSVIYRVVEDRIEVLYIHDQRSESEPV